MCIAVYLFSRWFINFRKKAGYLNTGIYLKTCSVCLQRYYSQSILPDSGLPSPISLTRCGLPRCIPSFHWKAIRERSDKSHHFSKFYLSIFSIYKLILVSKRMNYQYKSIVSPEEDLPIDF